MNQELEKVLEQVDWKEAARQYYGAPFGSQLLIWKDGTVSILPSGTALQDNSDVVASVKCPGLNNLDTSYFTDGFVEWDEEKEAYVSVLPGDEGRIVGDLWDVVLECIENGSVADDLRSELEAEL